MLHKVLHRSSAAARTYSRPGIAEACLVFATYTGLTRRQLLHASLAAFTTSAAASTGPDPRALAASAVPLSEMDASYDSQWVNHWKEGVDPGTKWDAGKCSPMLANLLQSKALDVTDKRVLVPGCGRGYDVFCFARAGAKAAVGLDLSPEAVAVAATERDKELAQQPEVAARAEFESGNFFEYVHQSHGQFDVGYDYTFLCALHPDMRKDWAKAWARLLAPSAELVTLIFPVGPGFIGNPPWQVSPELYQELLLSAGFEQVYLEPVPSELSHKGRGGREWLGRWRRSSSSSSSVAENGSTDPSTHSSNTGVSRM